MRVNAFASILGLVFVVLCSVAAADTLYSVDFDLLAPGTINGQDSWIVGNGDGTSTDGMVIDDGSGNQVLQVIAGNDWGDEVRRVYSAVSTKQFLVVTLRVRTKDGGAPFWFMDNFHSGPHDPDVIHWYAESVATNANPGRGVLGIVADVWHEVGFEVDQHAREITAILVDSVWYSEDDRGGVSDPGFHSEFLFRGIGSEERLWIDDLEIVDEDTSAVHCFPILDVSFPPSQDPQSFINSCWVSINGGVFVNPGCPVISRIEWDWGDGTIGDSFFPATHSYALEQMDVPVRVTAYNTAGDSTIRSHGIAVDDCLLFDNGLSDLSCCGEISANSIADDLVLDTPGHAHGVWYSLQDTTMTFPANWDGSLSWWLYEDGGGIPGSIIANGQAQNISSSFEQCCDFYSMRFDLGDEVTLEAATTYWLGLHMAADWASQDDLYWALTSPGSGSTSMVDVGGAGSWSDSAHHQAFRLLGNIYLFHDGFESGGLNAWSSATK